jgi:DNA-binding CsgD family transcriptional regulator
MNGWPLLEAAYDLGATPRERVSRLLAAAAGTFAAGHPVVACAVPPEWDFAAVPRDDIGHRGADGVVDACLEVSAAMPRDERLALYHAGPACIVASAAFRYSPTLAIARSKGVADMVALVGNSGDGGGVVVSALSADAQRWPAQPARLAAAARRRAPRPRRPRPRARRPRRHVDRPRARYLGSHRRPPRPLGAALPRRPLASAVVDLSEAERAIMVAVAAGKRTRAIARERGTSARTVANQLASIYRKAGVASRRELLARFG